MKRWLEGVSFEGLDEKQKQAIINYYTEEGRIFYAFSPRTVITTLKKINELKKEKPALANELEKGWLEILNRTSESIA